MSAKLATIAALQGRQWLPVAERPHNPDRMWMHTSGWSLELNERVLSLYVHDLRASRDMGVPEPAAPVGMW